MDTNGGNQSRKLDMLKLWKALCCQAEIHNWKVIPQTYILELVNFKGGRTSLEEGQRLKAPFRRVFRENYAPHAWNVGGEAWIVYA